MRPFYQSLLIVFLCNAALVGQRCGYTDTIAIGNFGDTPVTISIEDYLNNDLADPGQGLCEVSLFFQHSYVYDFTVTVTSPGGQSVDLIGPDNNQTRPATTLARWFIDFQRCDSLAAPDGGAPPVWDNNHPYNWPAFGVYQGDYFPADGCLEDFNTGPVNGDWTFNFNTARPGEQGVLTYVLLTFCDDANANGPCCFADAGALNTDAEIVTCEQAADLPLDYPPRYFRPRPDTALYDYTYAIARNDSFLFVQDEVNLANLPAGDYEICGLSYQRGDLGNLPLDGSLSPTGLRTSFASPFPLFCGDLTPVCQRVRLVPLPDTTFLDRTVCVGGSVTVGDQTYTTTDRHVTTLPGFAGCDSVVVLDLMVVDVLRETADVTICAEAVYPQGDNVYNQAGTYVDTIPSVLGCDSIVTLNLSFAEPLTGDTSVAICAGDTFELGGVKFYENSNDFVTIPAANGCDSTVNVDVIVLDPRIRLGPYHQRLTCDLPNTFLNASNSDLAFFQTARWLDTLGNTLRNDLGVTADTGGVYIFELVVGTRGATCTVRDTIVLPDIRFNVALDLALTQVQCDVFGEQCAVINCRNPEVGVRALAGPPGPDYDYTWTVPPGGSIVGLVNGAEILVDGPGLYSVTVEDLVTGCRRDTAILIGIDTLQPVTTVSGNELLDCLTPEIILTADTSQLRRGELDFVWTGDCLTAPVSGPVLVTDCPGNVTLTVTNRTNFCSRDTTFAVRQDTASVNLNLAPAAAPLNCYAPQQILAPTLTTDPARAEYAWTRNGNPALIGDRQTLDIFGPGTYELIATDSFSRCADTVSVFVGGDTLRPVAAIDLEVVTLNCYQPAAVLGSSLTSTGFNIEYAWTRADAPTDTIETSLVLPVSGTAGVYRLAVFNRENGCRGLDSAVVTVALDTPRIQLDLPLDFDCFIDSVLVDASATVIDFTAQQSWSGPCLPNSVDTNRIAPFCPGTYVYTLFNEDNGCFARDSVEVLLADNSVVAVLPDSAFIDCDTGQTRLDRRLGTDAPVVRWFRDGVEVSLTGMQPFVTVPGTYTVVLGNFNESCLDTARTIVVADCPVFPIIVPPDSITCNNPSVLLDARPSVPVAGENEISSWITPAGAITVPGPDDRQLIVLTDGRYGFAIENTVSGDRDTFFVDIIRNTVTPVAEAGPRDTITCYEPFAFLDGSASTQGDVFDYLWTTTSGDSLGNADTLLTPASGGYLLRVTQRFTGCSDIDNVFVLRNTDVPDLTFSAGNIPCDTVDFALAVIPDEPGEYTYAWSGPAILAQANQDTVRLSEAGEYSVTLTNVDNGCTVANQTAVERLPCPPFPSLTDTTLTCLADTISLVATFRDPCTDCQFRWERNGTGVVGQFDSILPVYRAGVYRLLAINEFGLQGEAFATVTDSRVLPEDNAGPDAELSCRVQAVTLTNVAPEPDFPYAYRWIDPAGNPVAGATTDALTVNTGGLYQLETTNLFSNCTVLDTVEVTYDTVSPVSVAGPGRLLDCTNKLRTLDGINSSLGDRFAYQWTSQFNALCLEGSTTLNPIVRCGGFYTLTVTDTVNGCMAASQLFVEVDEELPNVIPLPDTTVNCSNGAVDLVGREITGNDREYYWEQVLPGDNVRIPESAPGVITVNTTGTFRFLVRDTISGCSNEFTVGVSADLAVPTADAGLPDTFFCALDSLLLDGVGTTDRSIEPNFIWTSQTGFQINAADQANAVIFQPDRYYLEVTDPVNFCTALDSVTIFRDVEAPVAFAGNDTTLTCSLRSLRLGGSGTTVSGQSSYLWTSPNGNISAGSQTVSPLITQAGQYQFNITDPVNDCTGADIVQVTEDTLRPVATVSFLQENLLNCYAPEIEISAALSSGFGSSLVYEWSGPQSELTDERDQFITVGGDYQLVVVNTRNDCRDTAAVTVVEDFTQPVNPVNPALPLTCIRDSVVLTPVDGSNATYAFRWFAANGQLLGDADQQTVGATGNYRLETLDTGNGCRDTSGVLVFEDRLAPEVAIAEPQVLNCTRTFALIDGTASNSGPGFTADWTGPAGISAGPEDPFQVLGRSPGFHYLTVTNVSNGCATTDSVELRQSAVAVEELIVDVIQPACSRDESGEVMVLGVTGGAGPFRYRLDNGILTDRIFYDGLPIGTYDLDVVGSDGCDASVSFTIEAGEEEFVELRPDTTIRLGDSLPLTFFTNLTNYDTLIWTSSGPLPANITDGPLWVRPLVSQGYRIQVLGGEGCLATDNVVIQVDETVNIYVPNAFSPNGDNNNDVLRPYVGPQVEEITRFRMFNRWGELVYDLATDPARGSTDFGWDGKLKGRPLKPQVFAWEMEVLLVDGTRLRDSGDVVLMR